MIVLAPATSLMATVKWQDPVLASGSLVFIIALVPSLVSTKKPALSTSVLTGTVLAAFAAVYASLSLWFTTITTSVTSICWLVLALQQFRSTNRNGLSARGDDRLEH